MVAGSALPVRLLLQEWHVPGPVQGACISGRTLYWMSAGALFAASLCASGKEQVVQLLSPVSLDVRPHTVTALAAALPAKGAFP